MNSAATRQNNAKLADGGPAMALVDLLSKLDGPSGELDREICKHLGLLSGMTCEYNHWPLRVTSSVDAAIALAERVLPGWGWQVDKCGAVLRSGHALFSTDHSTPAIALCIALLRAKEAGKL